MSYTPQTHPTFSWSHSRDRVFLQCARSYYWRYYGSHNGWHADAPEEQREAYALKYLTTLPLVLGTAVHECARDSVQAVRRRTARPAFDAMLTHVNRALDRANLGSHYRDAFLADPKRIPMLRDVWYTGRQDPAALPRALAKARICLRALDDAAVWDDIAACRPGWVAAVDNPEPFIHKEWAVYAGPDVVYRPRAGQVVIVDWKTGDEADADLQIALYALYCRKALGLRFRDGEWFGRVINLATGTDTLREINRLDLLQAAERIEASVAAMQALLQDPERNEPLRRDAFPLVHEDRRRTCTGCEFYALCEAELSGHSDP